MGDVALYNLPWQQTSNYQNLSNYFVSYCLSPPEHPFTLTIISRCNTHDILEVYQVLVVMVKRYKWKRCLRWLNNYTEHFYASILMFNLPIYIFLLFCVKLAHFFNLFVFYTIPHLTVCDLLFNLQRRNIKTKWTKCYRIYLNRLQNVTNLSIVELSVNINLTLGDVASQIRNRMSDIWNKQTQRIWLKPSKWFISMHIFKLVHNVNPKLSG